MPKIPSPKILSNRSVPHAPTPHLGLSTPTDLATVSPPIDLATVSPPIDLATVSPPIDLATVSPLPPKIYDHYDHAPWDEGRWPDFSPAELACSHCGEFYYDGVAFDCLQRLRNALQAPVLINSAHRCVPHNRAVGGRTNSAHLQIAFDIAIGEHRPPHLYDRAQQSGFTNFGFYQTFLHVDLRPPVRHTGQYRRWQAPDVDMHMWQPQTAPSSQQPTPTE